jgi:D-amino peptidase
MEVFVSADMEGVTGVAAAEDVVRGEAEYDRGREALHADVNAAVEGAAAGGADSVLVNDSHASMRNLDRGGLDARATLMRGNTKPRSMMQGLTANHDVALFVGYHAMAGTAGGVLNHTFHAHELVDLLVDGTEVGELGWNARFAGALEVPVGLVTGDDATVAEAGRSAPAARTVAVKEGIDRFTAACRPASETGSDIELAAQRAVERAADGNLPTRAAPEPVEMSADWATTNQAARAAGAPGVAREDDRRTAVAAERYVDAFEETVGMLRAGAAGTDEFFG